MTSHFFAQITWSVAGTALTIVVLVGAAVIVLLSRRREDVHQTLTATVSAQKELQGTTEKKLQVSEKEANEQRERADKLEERNKALEGELKAASLEYSQLALLDVAEWLKADRLKRENIALREENRDLLEENRQLLRSQKRDGEGS
jgi:hypothetical protein